jgi:hypothetical protein
MPRTLITTLPATKSDAAPAIIWRPDVDGGTAGELEIDCRIETTYRVTEFATGSQGWDGRAFRLVKIEGGSDKESEAYDVFCAAPGGHSLCDCKGFAYGKGKDCKHIAACREVIRLTTAYPAKPAPTAPKPWAPELFSHEWI